MSPPMRRSSTRSSTRSSSAVTPGELTPERPVPASIQRPDYVSSGEPTTGEPAVKDADTIARMRRTGRLAAEVLDVVGRRVEPGITTDELDAIAHDEAVSRGAYPSPLGYRGYPKSICTSVNEVICHGIPDSRELEDGDILNIDVTVYAEGVHGDTSRMFLVGDVDEDSHRLVRVTKECLDRGIAAVRPGKPVHVIGRAIQDHAKKHDLGVVKAFVGHGIGRQFHGEPTVPHYHSPHASTVMQPGMTFTIEPMITLGTWRHRMWDDGWTAVTADGSRSAQWEHTLVVAEDGAEVLTLPPDSVG